MPNLKRHLRPASRKRQAEMNVLLDEDANSNRQLTDHVWGIERDSKLLGIKFCEGGGLVVSQIGAQLLVGLFRGMIH